MLFKIKAIKDNKEFQIILNVSRFNSSTTITFQSDDHLFESTDEFPFFALVNLRVQLEQQGVFIICNGSRLDVYPSGNSLMSNLAYVMKMGKQADKLVNIFESTKAVEKISSVEQQKKYRSDWLDSLH